VLRLENSEADIVQTILDGLSPACRSYLVIADKRPPTLIWIICVSRQLMPNKLRSALSESPTRPSSISQPTPSSNSSMPRPAIECFYCHRQGHMIGNCPIRPPRRRIILAIMIILQTLSAHFVAPYDYCLIRLSRLFLIRLGAQECTPCHYGLFPGFVFRFLTSKFALCWIRVVLALLSPFHCMIDCVS
jgi:hypothetical protein